MVKLTHGSLFTGIGGFDLAAEWVGWTNIFQCDNDKYCTRILEKNFPEITRYGDIKQFNATQYYGKIDVLSGGFPCQPFSIAGKRKGSDDDRFLWPEMLRIISEIAPTWVIAENVSGLLTQEQGVVFERCCTDLEALGYEVQPLVIPACAVNAPHRRDRLWIIAHSFGSRFIPGQKSNRQKTRKTGKNTQFGFKQFSVQWTTPDSDRFRFQKTRTEQQTTGTSGVGSKGFITDSDSSNKSRCFDRQREKQSRRSNSWYIQFKGAGNYTQSPVCRRDDGIPNRVDRIKSLGNAIVPQVAYQIFKAISNTYLCNCPF